MMTTSGEHNNDSYDYIDAAIKRVSGSNNITKLGMYYFNYRCDQNKEVDETFIVVMDNNIKGNCDTTAMSSIDKESEKEEKARIKELNKELNSEKKRVYSSIIKMCKMSNLVVEEMHSTNKVARETAKILKDQATELKKQNKLLADRNIIKIAQSLGRSDILNSLLDESTKPAAKSDSNKKTKTTNDNDNDDKNTTNDDSTESDNDNEEHDNNEYEVLSSDSE
jgi:hypothetical protein